jgi:hypothetical protein
MNELMLVSATKPARRLAVCALASSTNAREYPPFSPAAAPTADALDVDGMMLRVVGIAEVVVEKVY